MRRLALVLALAVAGPSFAQKEVLFRPGDGPLMFKEQDLDRRFKKSKLAKALYTGTEDPNCQMLISGLFAVLAEAAPYFHRRDENFTLDPNLLAAMQAQLSTPAFPAASYFMAMVRRVLIDRKVPDEWVAFASQLAVNNKFIDIGKLKALNEGLKQIDNFMFTLPMLRDRYIVEVVSANSAVTSDVAAEFRDTYIDREVAWGGALLVDAGLNKVKKAKKGQKFDPNAMEEIIAILQWVPPDPNDKELNLLAKKADKPIPITIYAKLRPKQYLDLERLPRGKRLIVKGRFYEMNLTMTEVLVKDALLFEDRDFNRGVWLGDPEAVAACPLAINEITGVAPVQPGGFKH